MPTPVRTAMCSAMMPPPRGGGYSAGMSQPLNSTIFAPIWRWTAFSAVLRMVGASTEDNRNLKCEQWLAARMSGLVSRTDYRNMPIFGGSNPRALTTENTEEHRVIPPGFQYLKILTYRPNCTVTRAPAGTWVPATGDCCRSEERRVGKECRSRWSP